MPIPGINLTDPATYHNQYISSTGIPVGPNGENLEVFLDDQYRAITLNYHRWAGLRAARFNFVPHIINACGLVGTESIAIIGAGFGWGAEELQIALPGLTIAAVDTGSWIQANKDTDEQSEIETIMTGRGLTVIHPVWGQVLSECSLGNKAQFPSGIENIDISTNSNRRGLKSTYNGNANTDFDWVITEQVLPWITDNEAGTLDGYLQNLGNNVAHYTSIYDTRYDGQLEPDPVWNWKHLDPASDTGWNKLNPIPAWYTETNWKTLLPNSLIVGVQGQVA